MTQATDDEKTIYTLEIFITSGPITKSFAKKNKIISRTIQIRGDQTLDDLHHAIFEAFDREEEHMYEFQMGGKGRANASEIGERRRLKESKIIR